MMLYKIIHYFIICVLISSIKLNLLDFMIILLNIFIQIINVFKKYILINFSLFEENN